MVLFKVVLNIFLTVAFFFIVTPINMALRIVRFDPLKLKFKRSKKSLFVKSNSNPARIYQKGKMDLFVKEREDSNAPDTIYPMW